MSNVNLLVSFSAWAGLVWQYLLEVTHTINPSSIPGSTLTNCSNPDPNPDPNPGPNPGSDMRQRRLTFCAPLAVILPILSILSHALLAVIKNVIVLCWVLVALALTLTLALISNPNPNPNSCPQAEQTPSGCQCVLAEGSALLEANLLALYPASLSTHQLYRLVLDRTSPYISRVTEA